MFALQLQPLIQGFSFGFSLAFKSNPELQAQTAAPWPAERARAL